MYQIIFLAVVSTLSSLVGAISGIGGGIIMKPVLDAATNLSIQVISFLSSGTVFTLSGVSLFHSRKGEAKIEKRRGSTIAIGAMIGGVLGKEIFDIILKNSSNKDFVGAVQSIIIFLMTIGVLIYVANKKKIAQKNVQNLFACAAIGAGLGGISSFLGIGGGPANIAVLSYVFGMDTKSSAIHSLYLIFFSQLASIVVMVLKGSIPAVNPLDIVVMVIGASIGGIVGRKISNKLSDDQADRFFIAVLVLVALIAAYNTVSFLK